MLKMWVLKEIIGLVSGEHMSCEGLELGKHK